MPAPVRLKFHARFLNFAPSICRFFFIFSPGMSCFVEFEVPPGEDSYPPIQELASNVTDSVDREWWLEHVMRPIPNPNRSRISVWHQSGYYHPQQMKRCLYGHGFGASSSDPQSQRATPQWATI